MKIQRKVSLSVPVLISLCLLALYIAPVENANILVIDGVVSPSHQLWMRALSFALGNVGHNVTVLSCAVPKETIPPTVHYVHMPEMWAWVEQDMDFDMFDLTDMNSYVQLFAFLPMYKDQNDVALNSTGYKTLLKYPKDFKFDLMIHDYLSPHALLSLKEVFNNPPLVAVSPYPGIGMTDVMTHGPAYFSFLPHMFKDEVKDSFLSRLDNFVLTTLYYLAEHLYILPVATKSVHEFVAQQKQTIEEIFQSSVIQMANYHPVIDPVHPIMPSVIPVGGLQIAEPKPLPEDLEEIYSRKSKGTILFSLGSNVKSELLGAERLSVVIAALGELLEYNFIWKIDMKGLDLQLPKNVFIKNWLPQNDMLADNRTVLFISHAGGLSTQECTWFGVPMLALPVMFDQFPNSERVVKMGMGLKLDIQNIQKDVLKSTILELLTNKDYSRKAQLMSRNFRDQPEKPIDRALWWIEYVLRNPDVTFLQSKRLKEMNYMVKHSMDVIAFLTVVILVVLISFFKITIWVLKRKASPKNKVKKH